VDMCGRNFGSRRPVSAYGRRPNHSPRLRTSRPRSTEVSLDFLGTLPAYRPPHDIAKLVIKRPRLADAGSVATTLPGGPLKRNDRPLSGCPVRRGG
jgi:hypothetical protein